MRITGNPTLMKAVDRGSKSVLNERESGYHLRPQSFEGSFGRTERRNKSMAHYNCCVPNCNNGFRNAPSLRIYRIPKDPVVCQKYVVLARNETLKVDSQGTRICSTHLEGHEM